MPARAPTAARAPGLCFPGLAELWSVMSRVSSLSSGGHRRRLGQGGPLRADGAAVWEQFATVIKHDDAVAQHAPALLGVIGDNPGRQVIGCRPLRAPRLMLTHCLLRCRAWRVCCLRISRP